MPHIIIGDDSPIDVIRKGFVDVGTGNFEDVLDVHNFLVNLIFVYIISQNGRKVDFTPNFVTIRDLEDNALLVVGKDNHESHLYDFSHFVHESRSTAFLTHSNPVRKIWHEQFVHLNIFYLQQLNMQNMVIGLPQISFSDGFCLGCSLGKHPKDKFNKGKVWRALEVLELVQNDVAGPFPSLSFNKAHYLLTFFDDFSRYTWAYFI